MAYTGPKKIVILGGGIAGLAAADAITKALEPLARAGTLPPGIEVKLVEGEADLGGRAVTWKVDDIDASEHPHRPSHGHTPHGIHFTWHSYKHFLEWTADAQAHFTPAQPTSTYCAWLAAPDTPDGPHDPARVVALHVCDPRNPDSAWDPRVRLLLKAFLRRDAVTTKLEQLVRSTLLKDIEFDDWLSFLDILFDEKSFSPHLRWGLFFGPAFAAQLGQVETSATLKNLLGGRAPQDVEVGSLLEPMFNDVVKLHLDLAGEAVKPLLAVGERVFDIAGGILSAVGLETSTARAVLDFLELIARDAKAIADTGPDFDPRQSAYLKNLYKAAFSSPYAFDLSTGLRDIQMGHRNFQSAKLQVFDGDDAQAVWNTVRDRIQARLSGPNAVPGSIEMGTWARQLKVVAGRVVQVELTTTALRQKKPVPMVDVVEKAPGALVDADVVVSSLLPVGVRSLLTDTHDPAVKKLRRRLGVLGKHLNETVNLQLFFERRIELPFVDPPHPGETPPFSISNLQGIFTILVDLKRAWSPTAYGAIRLAGEPTTFTGTAWELVGGWGDLFTHDRHAVSGRYQWPLGIQQHIASLAHDPNELEPWSIDERPWVFDTGAPGWAAPPPFGQVKESVRALYFQRWVEQVGPSVVEQTLRQIAAMHGVNDDDRDYLKDLGARVCRGEPHELKYVFNRCCHAENKFFSAEPGLYSLRPHARFETDVKGLWCTGDWTRNGLNVQAMEGAVVAGLQSALGVLEAMRAGGLTGLVGPRLHPDMVPNGAWDPGP